MRRFLDDFYLGLASYRKAVTFILTNSLSWFFIFPVVLNIAIFAAGFSAAGSVTVPLQEWVLRHLGIEESTFTGSSAVKWIISGFIWVLMKIMLFFVYVYFSGYVILVFLSPVLAYLSEKTGKILTGKDYPLSLEQLVREIARGIVIAFRNMLLETVYMVVLFFLGFVPVIGWLSPAAMFVISSYYYGFSFMDYSNERNRLSVGASVLLVRRYKGIAVANGAVFSLFLLIPFCGVALAGFAAIVSVVAATLAMHGKGGLTGS